MRIGRKSRIIYKERGENMRKKLLAIALCVCTAFSIAACGGDDTEKKTEAKITLGEYKGIKVDATLEKVDEEDIQDYLDSVLKSKSTEEEVTGVTFAKDDIAKLDYTCTIDGKEYKKATGAKISIDDKGFDVDGFTDSIIGKNTGDEYEIKITLSKDFADTTVAGKEATFKIKLQAKINVIIPEFTDEFVAKNFDYLELTTKEQLLDYLERDLRINQVYGDIWEKVVLETAKVESYDSDDLAAMTKEYAEYQEYYIYQYTQMSLDAYLKQIGKSKDDFNQEMEDAAKDYLKREMVVKAIAEKENIVITDEIYQKEMLRFAKSYGYDTVADFEKDYSSSMTKEDFEYTVLTYLVEELVCQSVEFVEGYGVRVEEPTTTQGTTGNETTSGEATTGNETTTAGGETTTGDETTTAGEEKSTEEETTTAA